MPPNADLSLLFRLRGDNTQLKSTVTDSRAAVNQLRQSFGIQLVQSLNLTNETFSHLEGNLQNFVAQRVPLIGGAVVRITEGLRNVSKEGGKTEKALATVARSIQSIASQSGRSVPQVTGFLAKFAQLETQAKKNDAAFKFFGGSVDLIGNKTGKFVPELEEASTALNAVSAASATAGAKVAGMAGPIGIAVLAFVAFNAVGAIAIKQLIDLTKYVAEFQGRMVDLAQQTGLAVESLSALEVVAKTTSGNLDTIIQTMVLFQRKLDEAQNPLSKTAELFRKFNIETSDTESALRSAFNALAEMPEGFAQTNAAAELFGARGGKQVLAILKEANGNLDETIKRLKEMGILISDDAARAADKLNDELALLELQWRALVAAAVQDLIPALADIVRALGRMITAIRPVISLLGSLAGTIARPVVAFFKGMSLAVLALTGNYIGLAKAIKEANEAQNIGPIKVPGPTPVPLPGQPTPEQSASEAVNDAEAVLAAVKRRAEETNRALDSLFQQGRVNRDQEAASVIATNKRVLEAEQQRIDTVLRQRELEIRALDEAQKNRGEIVRRDTDDYRAITAEIVKLQQERLDKESEFEVTSREIRARAAKENADARRNQIANDTDILAGEFDRQIKVIEGQIGRQEVAEEDGLTIIEALERAKVQARIESLERQKQIGFLTVQNQIDLNNELQKLSQEEGRLGDEQIARRLQRSRDAAERIRDITLADIDARVQILQIRGQRIIDATVSLADARVITEEQAAKKILKINLDLIDAEIEAAKARLTAVSTIVNVNERLKAEADLNNQIKILTEHRTSIEADGERAVHEGLKRDIENRKRYANDLRDISDRIRQIQRDGAREAIRLMEIHFVRRKDIIRAETQLDLQQEKDRHREVGNRLRELERENRESNRTQQEKLEFEKELNRAREAENERHRLAMQGIKDQGKKDDEEASPLGRILGIDTDTLKEFASVIEQTVIPLGQLLTNTFLQVADALGQTISNWVLLGETGPAVMRKLLAQALASIAAEATVQAVKELALGFATLFLNPAESAAHFTAAGLWAGIAGGSALAGRAVAGDLFKKPEKEKDREGKPGQVNPLALERNSQQQVIRNEYVFRVESNDSHIVDVFSKDYQSGGKTREIIIKDGEFAI